MIDVFHSKENRRRAGKERKGKGGMKTEGKPVPRTVRIMVLVLETNHKPESCQQTLNMIPGRCLRCDKCALGVTIIVMSQFLGLGATSRQKYLS